MADRTLVLFWNVALVGVRTRIVQLTDPRDGAWVAAHAIFSEGADLVACFNCDLSNRDLVQRISAGVHLADMPGITGMYRAHPARGDREILEVIRMRNDNDPDPVVN